MIEEIKDAAARHCVKSAIRRTAKRTPDLLKPQCISIRKWTAAHHGDETRRFWITDQILTACGDSEELAKGLYIDDDGDISLDERGISDFSDILVPFFGETEVVEAYREFAHRNEYTRLCEGIQKAAADMTDAERMETVTKWKAYKPCDDTGKEMKRFIINTLDVQNRY